MYRTYDETNGIPPRLYRHPEEIKTDIKEISQRISEINEMLNIRELLADFLLDDGVENLRSSSGKLSELLTYALEALDELKALNETLEELKDELVESVAIMR